MSSIHVSVKAEYLSEQSDPKQGQYVYAYTITIHNQGSEAASLLNRHWVITDGNDKIQEVKGVGVLGEQPRILPGESYTYTSGVVMMTDTGMMSGTYTMANDHHEQFDANIPAFSLARPQALH